MSALAPDGPGTPPGVPGLPHEERVALCLLRREALRRIHTQRRRWAPPDAVARVTAALTRARRRV